MIVSNWYAESTVLFLSGDSEIDFRDLKDVADARCGEMYDEYYRALDTELWEGRLGVETCKLVVFPICFRDTNGQVSDSLI